VGTTRAIKVANPISDYWYGVLGGFLTQDSLVRMDPKLNFKPSLAEHWEVTDKAATWKFYINQKARWHDGQPVTPQDVKFSLEYRVAKDPQSGWMKEVLKSAEVEGNAVVLRLNKPYAGLLAEFDSYRILPPQVWQKVDDPLKYTGKDATLGSGPYQLDKIDLDAGLLAFKSAPNHFEGRPAVDRLEFQMYRNVDAMTMALGKGDIDVTWDYSASLPYTSLPALKNNPQIKMAQEVDMGVPVALGFNLKSPVAGQKAFREAISYAIAYDKLAELVFAGYGRVPTAGFVPSSMPNYLAGARPLAVDTKKATDLLDAAGVKDGDRDGMREVPGGAKMELILLSRTDSDVISRSAELLQGYLKAVGLASKVRALDTATWTATKDKMEYDLVLFRTTPWGMLMHASYASGYFDTRRTGAGVLHNLDDPQFLAICDELMGTVDPAAAKQLHLKLQEYYANQFPGLAMAWADNVYPYNVKWDGWKVDIIHGGLVNRDSLFSIRPAGR
jgi:peptide/nickel transport system substrate-binding protein